MNDSHNALPIRPFSLALALFALPLIPGCSGEPPALTIGEVEFSDTDLLGFSGDRRTRLAEITSLGLAVARGEGPGLGAPLVARRTQISLLEALEREVALGLAGVEEEALEARYMTNPRFELTVRHLVVLVPEWATEEDENRARAKAEEALERIRGGEDFAVVAGEVSEEPGAGDRGGLLRPGRKGSWVDEFWNAASGLEVGEVSPVVRTQFGYHVLKLEGRTPLPFAEARNEVVQEVVEMLPDQSPAIQTWMDSVTATMAVDTSAITGAFEEAGSLFTFARVTLGGEAQAEPLVRWEGGEYTRGEFREFLLSLQRPSWQVVRTGGLPEVLRTAKEGARRSLLSELATSMGISVPGPVVEGFRQEWEATVSGWAMALGFIPGMSPEEVRGAALAAVASTAQGQRIAREEIQGWAPLLLSFYPIGPEGN